jgi:hypothetical protein
MDPDGEEWDELPPLLKTAALKLGYNQKVWDNHQRPARSDVCWSVLKASQKRAAKSLGYTKQNWDEVAELARGVKSLQCEIIQRQKQLKKLLKVKEVTAIGRIPHGREDSIDSHLKIDSTVSRQRQNPTPGQGPLLQIQYFSLHDNYYSFSAGMALVIHCFLYEIIHGLTSKATWSLYETVISYVSSWHFINNHFDSTNMIATYSLVAILFSMILSRVTGGIYIWNDNDEYQRRLDNMLRDRWNIGCWDVRIMNWFSGDEMSKKYGKKIRGATDHLEGNKWGPRIKPILDVISFYVCLTCVNYFSTNWIHATTILNMNESILEGLPSRRLHQQWTEKMGNDIEGNLCIGSLGEEDNTAAVCINSTDFKGVNFMSDVFNWATNGDRCGWVKKIGEADEEVGIGGRDIEKYAEEGNEEHDFCELKEGNETCGLSNVLGIAPNKIYPWKQANEELRKRMNILDDEYLRANLSSELYYQFVGDPHAKLVNPKREMISQAIIGAFCFVGLSWLDIPFLAP